VASPGPGRHHLSGRGSILPETLRQRGSRVVAHCGEAGDRLCAAAHLKVHRRRGSYRAIDRGERFQVKQHDQVIVLATRIPATIARRNPIERITAFYLWSPNAGLLLGRYFSRADRLDWQRGRLDEGSEVNRVRDGCQAIVAALSLTSAIAIGGCTNQPAADAQEGVPPITTNTIQENASVKYYPSDEPLRLGLSIAVISA